MQENIEFNKTKKMSFTIEEFEWKNEEQALIIKCSSWKVDLALFM